MQSPPLPVAMLIGHGCFNCWSGAAGDRMSVACPRPTSVWHPVAPGMVAVRAREIKGNNQNQLVVGW